MTFSLNQVFDDEYPPEAAQFCNQNGYVITEVEPQGGKRRFQIQSVPAPTADELFDQLRSERDARLADTDYMFTSDYPLDASKRAAYVAYRQALRDLPAQPGAPWTPDTIPWPVKPE